MTKTLIVNEKAKIIVGIFKDRPCFVVGYDSEFDAVYVKVDGVTDEHSTLVYSAACIDQKKDEQLTLDMN